MRTHGGNSAGLTLVEIVIALLILVVGVLAVAGLQASGLTATRTAQVMQRMNTVARSEIDIWRSSAITNQAPTTRSCASTGDGCALELRPCVLVGSTLDCGVASVTAPVAHAVTVTVTEGDFDVTLQTIVLR